MSERLIDGRRTHPPGSITVYLFIFRTGTTERLFLNDGKSKYCFVLAGRQKENEKMKHLVLLGERRRYVDCGEGDIVDCGSLSTEEGDGTLLLTNRGILILLNGHGEQIWKTDLNQECESPSTRWIHLTFVDPDIVCLSQDGAIVTVDSRTGAAELVGDFDNGIEAAGWSPDSEVLALVTQTNGNEVGDKMTCVLLTMNAQWDVLAEVAIECFMPSSRDDSTTGISLCWRPDGRLLAVSSVDHEDEIRRVRIYERDTLLHNATGRSEDGSGKVVPNLIAPVSWASSSCSNLLASIQRKGKTKQQVVFFEPNGLRHREFLLRDAIATVQALCWNVDSDLLGITLQYESKSEFQLWHRANYHWYLKQVLIYSDKITFSKFHAEDPSRFSIGLTGGRWREYQVCWDPSLLNITDSECTAFAIDGVTLHRTPLHQMLVPPPMYASNIDCQSPIRELTINTQPESSIQGVLYLSNGSLAVLNRPGCNSPGNIMVINTEDVDLDPLRQFHITNTTDFTIELVALSCGIDNDKYDSLVAVSIENGKATITNSWPLEGQVLRMINWSDNPSGVLIQLADGSFLEYLDGDITHSQVDSLLEPCTWIAAVNNPSPLVIGLSSKLRLYCHDRLLCDATSTFQISISHNFLAYATAGGSRSEIRFLPMGELHDFDPLMGSDENHLLEGYEPRYAERGARLVAILPKEPTVVLQMTRGNMEGIYPRALVLPHVMTQINEGRFAEALTTMRRQKVDLNLIVDLNPHQFVHCGGVDAFVEQVENIDYLNLFISCLQDLDVTQGRHRIPRWFLQSSERRLLGEPKVNLVCDKMRSLLLQAERDGHTAGGRSVSKKHFLLPILSTFAKQDPPKLVEALSMIRENAFANHPANSKKSPLLSETAQSSIKYLAFLADYDLLFNTALGMYDFDLARSVARNSQMDPKIYLALLKRLKDLPEHYGKYEVDVRLGRFDSALRNLYNSRNLSESLNGIISDPEAIPIHGNEVTQCLQLIDTKGLHRIGLALFAGDNENRQRILLLLGNDLLVKKHGESALSVFLSANPPYLEGAKEAARLCGDWRSYFIIALDHKIDEDSDTMEIRRRRIAQEIASEIASGKASSDQRIGLLDSARILLDYANDVVGAVEMLLQAEHWSEARRIALHHHRVDLAKKTADAAVAFAQKTINDLDDMVEAFQDCSARYVKCLQARKTSIHEAGGLGEGLDEADEVGSMFSVGSNASNSSLRSIASAGSLRSVTTVSSVISVGTQSSFNMTSQHDMNKHKSKFNKIGREKKKGARKKKAKIKIRAGSEEELMSLVSALKANCISHEHGESISQTILFLSRASKFEMAHELYNAYMKTTTEISTCQSDRIESDAKEKSDTEKKSRMDGNNEAPIVLPCEKEVDVLRCPIFPYALEELFSYY